MLRLWQNGPIIAIMSTMRRTLPLVTLALAASFSAAQDTVRNQVEVARADTYLGATIGTYFLTDGNTRDAFGSSPVTYGFGLAQPYRTAKRGLRFDVTSLSLSSSGNNFFLLGGTVGYEVQALNNNGRPSAFARVGVGPAYYHYDVNRAGNDVNGNRVSFLGTAEVGYTFAERFIVSARYLATPELSGYNFSGLQLSLTFAAFKL